MVLRSSHYGLLLAPSRKLRQVESGTPDCCRQIGVSEATIYIWKKKYAHLGVAELRQRRSLEGENNRLKRFKQPGPSPPTR